MRSYGSRPMSIEWRVAEPGLVDFRESVRKVIKENQVIAAEMLEVTDYLYSPTTIYEDYALNEYLFHWQSQNSASPESPVMLSVTKLPAIII